MRRALPAAAVLIAGAAIAATPPRPVRIGLEGTDIDACPSQGAVVGLNPRGDNFLTVRAGPGRDARAIARLEPGHRVHLCDYSEDGQWLGIVYDRSPRLEEDCRVGSPVPRLRPYRGPCHSGWVSERYIEVVAG